MSQPQPQPSRAEVLGWMSRLGRTAADAADHFWPETSGKDRARVVTRIRKWSQRAREAGHPDAPERYTPERPLFKEEEEKGAGERPQPDYERARLPTIEFLEWQLAEAIADLCWARQERQIGRLSGLDARVSELRGLLDAARVDGGRVVKLDRSPSAVAEEMERRAKRIRELAARAAEREL